MVQYSPEFRARAPLYIQSRLPLQDSAVKVRNALIRSFETNQVANATDQRWVWEQCGCFYLGQNRTHEAISIFEALYQQMMLHQEQANTRVCKGVPLFWLHDCHRRLTNPVLAKRYLMLTVAEDAITNRGKIVPATTGTYHRCVWNGMREEKFKEYATAFWNEARMHRRESRFPEWILQQVDQEWMTEQPPPSETFLCPINCYFVRFLLKQLGRDKGKSLERLAHYLLSCVPGYRARMRMRSKSTDYDVLCAIDGTLAHLRSEIGHYFLCECKDWCKPADFAAMAKFCRVLDSTKTKFGILFSKHGITGTPRTTDAERELLKMFQQRGVAIIVITKADLIQVSRGASFIALLRKKYEGVRFDLAVAPIKGR